MRKLSLVMFALLFTCVVNAYNFDNRLTSYCISQHFLALQSTHLPKTKHQLVVIAHRGSHLKVPENTLAAYVNAIKEGADYVEIDLRTTKDGHLVIMHDESLSRMTGANRLVKDLNYSNLKDLKIAPAIIGDTTTYPIPELSDVLNVCKGKINIYLDFKDADVEKTYRLLTQYGMENNVVVYLNKEAQYEQWKSLAPHVPLMSSLPDSMSITQLTDLIDTRHLDVVDNAFDNDMVNLLHKKNIAVWLDVESEDEGPVKWEQALRLGADGLQTDHPEKLIKFLEEHRKR